MAVRYFCDVNYTDPLSLETEELRIYLTVPEPITDQELENHMLDTAATIIGEYKFADLFLVDPEVYVQGIEICAEEPLP